MWSADQLATIVNGKLINAAPARVITGFSVDTRSLNENDCFVAIPGKNEDGHNYFQEAYELGASAALIEQEPDLQQQTLPNIIFVHNSVEALHKIAKFHRSQFDIPIIGITGSSGKTTTKELLFHILSQTHRPFRSPGNYNTEIGLPLALLQMPADSDIGIFELGLQHPGDISKLCEILDPTHGLITSIGEAHLENFENQKALADEKLQLAYAVKSPENLAFNLDSDLLAQKLTIDSWSAAQGFGVENQTGKVTATKINPKDLSGLTAEVLLDDESLQIRSSLLGKSNIYAILGAIIMARMLEVQSDVIARQITSFKPISGRMELIETPKFGLIIDDSYNANPASMKAAIEALNEFEVSDDVHKVLIIGDMLELGDISAQRHREIATQVASSKVSHVFTIGNLSRLVFDAFSDDPDWKLRSTHSENLAELTEAVRAYLTEHPSLTLIKGSRGMNLDILVKNLR